MVDHVLATFGGEGSANAFGAGGIDLDATAAWLRGARSRGAPCLVLATSLALDQCLRGLDRRGLRFDSRRDSALFSPAASRRATPSSRSKTCWRASSDRLGDRAERGGPGVRHDRAHQPGVHPGASRRRCRSLLLPALDAGSRSRSAIARGGARGRRGTARACSTWPTWARCSTSSPRISARCRGRRIPTARTRLGRRAARLLAHRRGARGRRIDERAAVAGPALGGRMAAVLAPRAIVRRLGGAAALATLDDERLEAAFLDAVAAFRDPASPERRGLDPALRAERAALAGLLDASLAALLDGFSAAEVRAVLARARAASPRGRRGAAPRSQAPHLIVLAANLPGIALRRCSPRSRCAGRRSSSRPRASRSSRPRSSPRSRRVSPRSATPWRRSPGAAATPRSRTPLLDAVDRVVAYGGAKALADLRRRAGERLIAFGPKASVALVAASRRCDLERGRRRSRATSHCSTSEGASRSRRSTPTATPTPSRRARARAR